MVLVVAYLYHNHNHFHIDFILETFGKASGININIEKSCFLYNNIAFDSLFDFARVLPYRVEPIQTRFNYLGYFLKPLGYRVCDW